MTKNSFPAFFTKALDTLIQRDNIFIECLNDFCNRYDASNPENPLEDPLFSTSWDVHFGFLDALCIIAKEFAVDGQADLFNGYTDKPLYDAWEKVKSTAGVMDDLNFANCSPFTK